jgi:thiol-disulfide isomerase/thioredoxin
MRTRKQRRGGAKKVAVKRGIRHGKTAKKGTSLSSALDIKTEKQVPNFEQLLKKKGALTIVFVYADWCPHCHDYKPKWNEICKSRGRNVNMVAVNESVLPKTSIPMRTTIEGYPTVIAVNGTTGETANIPNFRDDTAMKTLAANGSTAVSSANTVRSSKNNTLSKNSRINTAIDDFINENMVASEEPELRNNTPYPTANPAAVSRNGMTTIEPPNSDEDFVESLGYKSEDFTVENASAIEGQRGGRRKLRRLRGGY